MIGGRIGDHRLNIATTRRDERAIRDGATFADGVRYETVPYSLLRRYIARLPLNRDDVVYDIGCGMGRPLCLFARMGVRRCVGIELSPELAGIARRNADVLRHPKSAIEIVQGDAALADYSDGTVFFLHNPFGAQTMRSVIDRVHQSLTLHPRVIRVLYLYSVQEAVLQESGWLRCTARDKVWWSKIDASYWTNDIDPAVTAS